MRRAGDESWAQGRAAEVAMWAVLGRMRGLASACVTGRPCSCEHAGLALMARLPCGSAV